MIQVFKFCSSISSNIPILNCRHSFHWYVIRLNLALFIIIGLSLCLDYLILFCIFRLLRIKEFAPHFGLLAKYVKVVNAITKMIFVFALVVFQDFLCKFIRKSCADTTSIVVSIAIVTASVASNRILSRYWLYTWNCTKVFHTQ